HMPVGSLRKGPRSHVGSVAGPESSCEDRLEKSRKPLTALSNAPWAGRAGGESQAKRCSSSHPHGPTEASVEGLQDLGAVAFPARRLPLRLARLVGGQPGLVDLSVPEQGPDDDPDRAALAAGADDSCHHEGPRAVGAHPTPLQRVPPATPADQLTGPGQRR